MKILGLDKIVVEPSVCSAVNSNFKAVAPICLKIPIPLVAPATGKLNKLPAAPPKLTPAAPPAAAPAKPSVVVVTPSLTPFVAIAILDPSFLSKLELALTINASIKTCSVMVSICFTNLSTISMSGFLPLTRIDLV